MRNDSLIGFSTNIIQIKQLVEEDNETIIF